MAKRILVPLDGAPSSEAVLSLVGAIARSAGSTVRLLHVDPVPDNVEHENGRVIAYADQEMARLESEGLEYLEGLEANLQGVPVECIVRFGDPAREILVEAEAWGADLIAVTATPTSLFRRLFRRSGVVDRIARKADVPAVVYRRPDHEIHPALTQAELRANVGGPAKDT